MSSVTSIIARGRVLYAKLKSVDGTWRRIPTPFRVGDEARAAAWAQDRQREVTREVARREKFGGPLTVRAFAGRWLDARKTKTVGDDRARIEKHALPRIGHLLLTEVRPRHLRELVLELRADGSLSPKTIREVASILHTMFKSALVDELIASNPVVFERGTLPKKADKDPAWRAQAIFTRDEIEQILSDERIPEDRRVIYALKFFCGRHTEVLASTWERYDATTEPLGTLHVVETKSGTPRAVPVHPTLAKILAAWKLGGWARTYGCTPTSSDLIVRTRRAGAQYKAADTQVRFVEDLGKLGLRTKASSRNRRGHDLRRTLITLARADGAIDSLLRWVTHGPRPSEILDVYSSPPWASLCTEISKLRVSLREGKLVELRESDEVTVERLRRSPVPDRKLVRSHQDRPSTQRDDQAPGAAERLPSVDHVIDLRGRRESRGMGGGDASAAEAVPRPQRVVLDGRAGLPAPVLSASAARDRRSQAGSTVEGSADLGGLGPPLVQPSEAGDTANENERPRRDSNPAEMSLSSTRRQ